MKYLRNSMRMLVATGICFSFASNVSAWDRPEYTDLCPDQSSCTGCHRNENVCAGYGEPVCTDNDNDGYAIEGGECGAVDFNDRNPSAYPGAPEICTDGIDNNGNGLIDDQDPAAVDCPPTVVCTDLDEDGFYEEGESCGTLPDFNDNEASAYPGATEVCTDGIDNDGNGLVDLADPNAVNCPTTCTDLDGDGYSSDGGECGPVDCNDGDAAINPGADEICTDGIDNNCNGVVDNADENAVGCPTNCTDLDGDGYSTEGGSCGAIDCDDANATINPAAAEICDDGMDNNCNNLTDAADGVCKNDGKGNKRCSKGNKRDRTKDHSRYDYDSDEDKYENRSSRH